MLRATLVRFAAGGQLSHWLTLAKPEWVSIQMVERCSNARRHKHLHCQRPGESAVSDGRTCGDAGAEELQSGHSVSDINTDSGRDPQHAQPSGSRGPCVEANGGAGVQLVAAMEDAALFEEQIQAPSHGGLICNFTTVCTCMHCEGVHEQATQKWTHGGPKAVKKSGRHYTPKPMSSLRPRAFLIHFPPTPMLAPNLVSWRGWDRW